MGRAVVVHVPFHLDDHEPGLPLPADVDAAATFGSGFFSTT